MARSYLMLEGHANGAGFENLHYAAVPLPCPSGEVRRQVELAHRLEIHETEVQQGWGPEYVTGRAGLSVWLVSTERRGRVKSSREMASILADLNASGRRDRPDLSLDMAELADHAAATARIEALLARSGTSTAPA